MIIIPKFNEMINGNIRYRNSIGAAKTLKSKLVNATVKDVRIICLFIFIVDANSGKRVKLARPKKKIIFKQQL